jgi:MFS transporter, putative metabolite:H+ symporter
MPVRPTATINAGPRLDRLPLGPFHRRILALIAAGMFFDAFDIYLQGSLLGALVHDGWSTPAINASFLSNTFMGMLVGALAAGWIGDRFGRRVSYQVNLAIFGLASLAAALAPSMHVLIWLRFVMGVGLGAEIVVGYATLSEFIPPSHRGRWVGLLSLFTNFAVTVTGFVSLAVIPTLGWRYMFVIVGLGAMGVWVARKNMPESPRWLESRGRMAEAEAILSAIETECGGAAALPAPKLAQAPVTSVPDRLSYLFSPHMLRRTLLALLIAVTTTTVLYGFNGWLPTFLIKQGHGVVATLAFTAVMGLGAPLGSWVGSVIADRAGRRIGIIVLSLAWAVFGVGYAHAGTDIELMAVGFGVMVSSYALVSVGYAIYIPELFPTTLRMRGGGLAGAAGRLAAAGAQYGVVWAYGFGGVGAVSTCMAALLVILALVVLVAGIETRQRSLEDLSSTLGETEGLVAVELVAAGEHS